jgi:hypothetical protein
LRRALAVVWRPTFFAVVDGGRRGGATRRQQSPRHRRGTTSCYVVSLRRAVERFGRVCAVLPFGWGSPPWRPSGSRRRRPRPLSWRPAPVGSGRVRHGGRRPGGAVPVAMHSPSFRLAGSVSGGCQLPMGCPARGSIKLHDGRHCPIDVTIATAGYGCRHLLAAYLSNSRF